MSMSFETHHDAVHWRRIHRRKLRKGGKRQRLVARKLRQCRKGNRCKMEACRVCLRDFRIEWIGEATKVVVQRPTWTRCSIIPVGMLVPYGGLHGLDLTLLVRKIRKRLQRAPELRGRIIVGGLDVSLNLFNNVIGGWQFHLYLIVEGSDDEVLRSAIKSTFPPEPTALEPYNFSEVKEPIEAISYAYKAVFMRRSAWQDRNGGRHAKDLPLKGNDLRELLAFLGAHRAGARLILSGIRRNGRRLDFTARRANLGRDGSYRR
jgi:hypothetical protein